MTDTPRGIRAATLGAIVVLFLVGAIASEALAGA